eukprot:CAMPEP_0170540282 /NCGR_PEP_ID=MMETSP0211-20121228/308_1 /TAXON_ID=311385 /ORGANISM="Pseudokeronopsis sp., Strain OXSARD2" /LENGTH=103 /DNA_ID=CAMNT_0010842627 /DNA_START=140 /DNA_END=451 /DNA_ORIENTATION=+
MNEDEEDYKKLYKKLGENHKNKDVRIGIKSHLEEKPENNLSPGMWLSMNPQYRMDPSDQKQTVFRDSFKGVAEEPCDKIYFRKKDETSQYAEFLFKSKQFLRK